MNKLIQFILICLIFSCGKEEPSIETEDTYFVCKVDGIDYEAFGENAYTLDVGTKFSLYGEGFQEGSSEMGFMYLSLPDYGFGDQYEIKPNSISTKAGYIVNFDDPEASYTTIGSVGEGVINVRRTSNGYLEGTFNFKAEDLQTDELITVTEGKFRLEI